MLNLSFNNEIISNKQKLISYNNNLLIFKIHIFKNYNQN